MEGVGLVFHLRGGDSGLWGTPLCEGLRHITGAPQEGQGAVFSDGGMLSSGGLERHYLPTTAPAHLSLAAARTGQGRKKVMMDHSTLTPYSG